MHEGPRLAVYSLFLRLMTLRFRLFPEPFLMNCIYFCPHILANQLHPDVFFQISENDSGNPDNRQKAPFDVTSDVTNQFFAP